MRRLVVLVALALAVASCGDDDGTAASLPSAGDDDPVETTTTEAPVDAEEPAVEAEDPGAPDEGADPPVLVADLEGATEVPGPGDEGATGRTEIQADADGIWCFDMVAVGLDSAVTDAHIHAGAAGESGGVAIGIGPPTASEGDTDTWTDVCVPVDEDLQAEISDDPAGYYANVHTETFGAGAVRGQLQLATIFDLTLS